jgi:hypothetical protein
MMAGGPKAEAAGTIPLVAVDTVVDISNTASTIGSVDGCGHVASVGDTIPVDVVVQGVPAAGLSGASFDLIYDPYVVKVTGFDGAVMLSGAFTGFSDPVPDLNGAFRAESAVFTGYPSGDGVVARFTLEAVGAGSTALTIGDLVYGGGPDFLEGPPTFSQYSLTAVFAGQITVGSTACGNPTPTPWVGDVKKQDGWTWYRYPTGLTTQYWFQCGNPPESVDCRPSWITPYQQAVADWNSRPTGLRMTVIAEEVPPPPEPDVAIFANDTILGDPNLLGVAVGWDAAWSECPLSCVVRYGDVYVANATHAGPYGTTEERRATVAHELGHLFKLAHESVNYDCGADATGEIPHSVMAYDCIDPSPTPPVPSPCAYCGQGESWVQDWDVCGVNQAYPTPGVGNAGCLSAPTAASYFHSMTPLRIVDSRIGQGMPGGLSAKLGAAQVLTVQVGGAGGVVPAGGVTAAVLNVTVTQPDAFSYLAVYPSDAPRPQTSNLNFVAGDTRPNAVTVRVGPDGKVKIYNHVGSTHVIVDIAGWYDTSSTGPPGSAGSLFNAKDPTRILDTRNGTGGVSGPLAGGEANTLTFQMPGAVVPVAATAVVLNATVTQPTGSSFLTLYPADAPSRPTASNLNFVAGQTVPNLVTVKLSSDDRIKIYNHLGSTHVILDVAGYYGPSGQFFRAVTPARGLDTRYGTGGKTGKLGAVSEMSLKLPTVGGLPSSAANISAVVVNGTVTQPSASSFLTLFPSGTSRPTASNLNYVPSLTVANLAIVKTGSDGRIRIYNHQGDTHVIADVAGWFGP